MPTIDQLSEEQRAQVLEHHRDWNVTHEWWDTVFEDAKTIGEIIGFQIDDIYFSGFCSQGDGACFRGRCEMALGAPVKIRQYVPNDKKLHDITERWVQELRRAGGDYGWSCAVKNVGNYSHENCTQFTWDHDDHPYDDPDNWCALEDIVKDFMRWIYRSLESEYECLISDEAVVDALEANEIEFEVDEDGELRL